jgi:hypothetical protein
MRSRVPDRGDERLDLFAQAFPEHRVDNITVGAKAAARHHVDGRLGR